MTRVTHRADLRVWLVLSLVLHTFLLALPGRLIETVFPARPEVVCGMPADLTPDFEDIAISVIRMSREPSPAPVEARIAEDVDPDMGPQPPQLPAASSGSPERGGYGDSDARVDTRFFPPVPRLIVPPQLDNLEISTLSIDIRILVGVDGRPVKIEIPDNLTDPEIRKRLLESAARFRFEPARKGDLPIASWISLPLELEASATR